MVNFGQSEMAYEEILRPELTLRPEFHLGRYTKNAGIKFIRHANPDPSDPADAEADLELPRSDPFYHRKRLPESKSFSFPSIDPISEEEPSISDSLPPAQENMGSTMQPPTPRQRNRASALATRRFSSASQPSGSRAGSRRTSTQPGALMAGSSANIEDVYEDAEEIVEENGKELDLSRHVVFGSNRSATKAVVQASGHYIQQNSILPQLNAGEWIAYYEVHLLQVSTEDTVSVGIALPGAFLSVELDGSILG